MEESMIDTSVILSSMLSTQMKQNVSAHNLTSVFERMEKKKFKAQIYEMTKTNLNIRVYLTDSNGMVVFDSDNGRDEGKDYSSWNDVKKTLRGEYGARTTFADPDDPTSSVLYVAAPVMLAGKIAGVCTVSKPADTVNVFLETAKKKIVLGGVLSGIAVVLLGLLFSSWITKPIKSLTQYADAVRDGKRTNLPELGRSEIGELGKAFEKMRDSLEGKEYVENYVQTLTHEMKSPLSALKGAAELLEEDMPAEQKSRFLGNIRNEAERISAVVERMLQLSALESRKQLRDIERIDVKAMVEHIIADFAPVLSLQKISLATRITDSLYIDAERFLIKQAIVNLVQNAIDFSPKGGKVEVVLDRDGDSLELSVIDQGPGIPDYAQDRVFERFFSLPRPDTGKKSTGLGLAFVRETAVLHDGSIRLENNEQGGVGAILRLPIV
jgi:two-component system sensor histidine kinase CreC